MTKYSKTWNGVLTCAVVALILTWLARPATTALGFQKPAAEAPATHEATAVASETQVDAGRGALDRFLDSHPEIEGDIISDPQRINDSNYIHDHAELQAFLEGHPLIKADPRSFVSPESWRFQNRRSDMDEIFSWLVPFAVFICCLVALIAVMRTVLENRRWNKSFKVHEEVHTKLIEKFASGEELRGYMESDAGRRLLEWSPPMVETRAPLAVTRILWSLTAGLILAPAGIGFLWIRNLVPDATEGMLICGTLFLTVGIGFFCSAVISYGIAKHLGLLNGAVSGSTRLAHAGR
jgi:hypothetical protein